MTEQVYLAVDLGASGGRVIAGRLDDGRIALEEVHRFENAAVSAAGGLYWDLLGLWTHVQAGLRAAAGRYGNSVRSVGVDTWGVDFAFLGRGDTLLGNPRAYRDPHASGMLEHAIDKVGRREIFQATGLQFMPINSLYHLLALHEHRSPILEVAQRMLMMPDLFHWLLTGEKVNEFTNATTTQFFDPRQRNWSFELLSRLGLPSHFLGPITQPGEKVGALRPQVAADTQLGSIDVVLPGTHDTASAVLAVPAASPPSARPNWAYLSLGTWALLGVETPEPVITDECQLLNFTNEGGVGGTIRLLKNIAGLWLVQECRRVWKAAGKDYSWDQLAQLAAGAAPLRSLVDPDDASLMAPADMPQALRAACAAAGQPVPTDEGAVVRCALESVALKARRVLHWAQQLTGGQIETLHVVGGGTQNKLLCQMLADACGCRVLAGPVEATALGNVLVQAIAAGALRDIPQAREVVRQSFPLAEYVPHDTNAWAAADARLAAR